MGAPFTLYSFKVSVSSTWKAGQQKCGKSRSASAAVVASS